MATKKEIFAAAIALCTQHEASDKLIEGLTDLLEPKSGGATVVVEDVYNEEEGLLQCSVSGVWLPATLDFFYEDKSGKSPFNGLRRLSRQAESVRKTFIKVNKTSEQAIMNDVLDEVITQAEGKEKIAAIKALTPDYSSVTDVLPSDEDEDTAEDSE